ncbi:MAG: peptide chain release factor N(5)-glutamine methyltransferase [Pseudobutyrivibrio sp.]|nr:peptide chain release factor N(5)-glutamine methyltransferase [Pseudobutyrivibrio sp.]
MTYRQALENGILLLESEKIVDAQLDAWYLLSFVTGITRAQFFMNQREPMDEEALNKYQRLMQQRANHIPLQHITGEQEFMGITFKVNENVLVPRQDTETLVEETLKIIPEGSRVLDVCTGSGCILTSLVVLGQNVTGLGVDISADALEVARDNGERLVGDRAQFIRSNLFEEVTGKYNVIVSNPPYIKTAEIEKLAPEVREHEPRLALDGTDDGLFFYRKIVAQAPEYLTEDGWLLVEIGHDQGAEVYAMFVEAGFKDVQVIKDLARNNRVVKGHL